MSHSYYIIKETSINRGAMNQRIHRTTIDLDLDVLERARRRLQTTTIRETVDLALREVERRAALKEFAGEILRGELNMITPEELAELRRNPHYP